MSRGNPALIHLSPSILPTIVNNMYLAKLAMIFIPLGVAFSIGPGVQAGEPKSAAEQQLMVGFPPAQDKLVTKANWLAPPYNRYAYLHTREIFPSRPFARGRSPRKGFVEEIDGSLARIEMKGTNGEMS